MKVVTFFFLPQTEYKNGDYIQIFVVLLETPSTQQHEILAEKVDFYIICPP